MKNSKKNKQNLSKALMNNTLANLHAVKGGKGTQLLYNVTVDIVLM